MTLDNENEINEYFNEALIFFLTVVFYFRQSMLFE